MITIFNMEKISISNHLLAISSQHSFPPIYWQCKRPPLPFYSWATWGHMMSPPVKCLEHTAFPTESITKLLRLIVEVQACSPSRHVWNMMHKINGNHKLCVKSLPPRHAPVRGIKSLPLVCELPPLAPAAPRTGARAHPSWGVCPPARCAQVNFPRVSDKASPTLPHLIL